MKTRDWLMTGICLIGLLILCALLDRPVPKDCTTTLRDGFGNKHEYIGKITLACPIKEGC